MMENARVDYEVNICTVPSEVELKTIGELAR
jgi:hypothetical protein